MIRPNERPAADAGWCVLFAFARARPRAAQAERSATGMGMRMRTKFLAWAACGLPIAAAAFSIDIQNDQTHRELGGVYGIYQSIVLSTTRPDQVASYVCSGEVAVFVPAIHDRIEGPTNSGLPELWALSNYRTNPLPSVWIPEKAPPPTQDVHEFEKFTPSKGGFSIRDFIGRFGSPSRYLTGQWRKGEVYRLEGHEPIPDDRHLLQGPDFLIYDLPSRHAVALYVPKPPAANFTTSIIIDSKGNLLIPNMVELLLPQPPRLIPPSKLTAESNGKITMPDASGGKETIGTWTMRDRQLVVTTTLRNSDAVSSQDSIWLGGVEYVADIMVNEHEIICDPVARQGGTPHGEK